MTRNGFEFVSDDRTLY